MTYHYVTHAFGFSAHPQKKTKSMLLTPGLILTGQKILLSRAWCNFETRLLPQNLSGEKLKQAVELAARTASPHEKPGIFIFMGEKRAAIWTYDADKVSQISGVTLRNIVPESALHAPSDGAVLRTVMEGYEGQYWRDQELVASRWWPSEVSDAEWKRFCLSAERHGAGDTPKPDVELPGKRRKMPQNSIPLLSQLQTVSMSAWTSIAATIILAAVTYFGVRITSLNLQAASLQQAYETLWVEKSSQREEAARLSRLDRRSASVAQLFNKPHPLPPLGVALSAALADDGRIESIFYDSFVFEVSFTQSNSFSQRDFVARLEASPFITNVNLVQGQRADLWELTFTHAAEAGSAS